MSAPQVNSDQSPSDARPRFWQVLLAPWMYIHRPSKAAACMAQARWPAAIIAYILPVLILAATICFLLMWDATVERVWRDRQRVVREQSFSVVWQNWHEGGVCWVDVLVLSIVLFLPVLTAFVAWLLLPTVHRSGSVWRSYARAFRGASAGAGLLALLTLLIGTAIAAESNADDWDLLASHVLMPPTLIAALGCVLLLVFWLTRGVGSLAGDALPIELPPRCEGCGYDLTHRPTSGRCPECGLSIDSSLAPDLRRPGCRWENEERGPATWLLTVFGVVLSPTRFYGTLKLRSTMEVPHSFTRWNYGLIAAGALAWMVVIAAEALNADLICFLPLMMMLLVLLAAWGVHRLIGALATSWWVMNQTLPDLGWAKKVIAYESAYLWALCLYNGLFATAMTVNERWLSDWLAAWTGLRLRPFGMLIEGLAILGGNAVLLLLWLWRYHLAARAIRWSNF